jgi:hypothetical protein
MAWLGGCGSVDLPVWKSQRFQPAAITLSSNLTAFIREVVSDELSGQSSDAQ